VLSSAALEDATSVWAIAGEDNIGRDTNKQIKASIFSANLTICERETM